MDTTSLKASQMKLLETFQVKILRSMMGLSTRASAAKTRLLAGAPSISFEVWKTRFGTLNNILIGDTITRQYCVLAWHCKIENSWTYLTIKKLHQILEEEGIQDKMERGRRV